MTSVLSIVVRLAGVFVLMVSLLSPVLPVYAQSGGLASLFGQSQKPKFLPVHQAFDVKASQDGNVLTVAFRITPEHYVYQDKLSLTLPDGVMMSGWQFSRSPTMMDDPTFGKVAVFEEDVVASTTLSSQKELSDTIAIKWQGCAKAGLCYPPETVKTLMHIKPTSLTARVIPSVELPPAPSSVVSGLSVGSESAPSQSSVLESSAVSEPSGTQPSATAKPTEQPPEVSEHSDRSNSAIVSLDPSSSGATDLIAQQSADAQESTDTPSKTAQPSLTSALPTAVEKKMVQPPSVAQNPLTAPQTQPTDHTQANQSDPFGINERPVWAVGLLFLLGLLLAFTPCVYPMIPIVVSIVARQQTVSPAKGFLLSASYGVGVATAYGLLGMIIAWFGRAIGITGWLQNIYVLGVFAVLFAVLALAMFEMIPLRLPSRLSQVLQQKSQLADNRLGSMGGSFLAGLLSALVVSPCVSLPMAGALSAISTSGSVVLGFVALFALGLGLSLPLMMMGAIQGKFMPKSGNWLNHVKTFCGLLLLAVSLNLIERIVVSPVVLALWALWFAGVAVWLWQLAKPFAQALAVVGGIWAGCLVVGMATGHNDPWRPLAHLRQTTNHQAVSSKPDQHITTLDELDKILASQDKVLVDVTATWCVECRIMERTLFDNRPAVLAEYQVVRLDITHATADSQAVLERYGLFGPPALLIYRQGQLQEMLLGEVKREAFEEALAKF